MDSQSSEQADEREVGGAADQEVGGALSPARVLLRVLDEVDYPLLVVDQTGHIKHANHLARYELDRGQCIKISQDGVLQAQCAEQVTKFNEGLARAVRGYRHQTELRNGNNHLTVAFIPVNHAMEASPDTVLVACSKRQLCEPLSLGFYARQHSLTRAEENVLKLLASGVSPEQIAQEQGIAISTVRTQIGNIRTKTNTHSVRELMYKVFSLPPFVNALRMI